MTAETKEGAGAGPRRAPSDDPREEARARYDTLALLTRDRGLDFMNYGFDATDPDAGAMALDEADEAHRYHIQLYAEVCRPVALPGLDVLEVGSGRGGGAHVARRYLGAASVTGVELSPAAVELSRRRFAEPGLDFVVGDAERLPCPDAAFDVVLNVESSHCYPNIDRFLDEVRRVLRPGGWFLYADFGAPSRMASVAERVQRLGLALGEEQDITANVVASLERDNDRKDALFREIAADDEQFGQFRSFARQIGSRGLEWFRRREEIYVRYAFRKAEVSARRG